MINQVSADDTINNLKTNDTHEQLDEYDKIELDNKLDQVMNANQENNIKHDLNTATQDNIESYNCSKRITKD